MSIQLAEQLKGEYTDQLVVVDQNVPELRRFLGRTGTVKTVNMSCRALVEFDGTEDIGWYDIDTRYLTIVDAPVAKEKPQAAAKPAADKPAAKAAAKSETAKPAAKTSPLDAIRSGAAGGAAPKKPAASGGSPLDAIRSGSAAAPAAKKPAAGGGSPLDAIRAGAAAAPKEEAAPAKAEAPTPKPKPAPAPAAASDSERASRLSIIERLRMGTTDATPPGTESAAPAEAAPPAEEPAAEAPAAEEPAPAAQETVEPAEETIAAPADEDLSGLSIIERIRRGGGG